MKQKHFKKPDTSIHAFLDDYEGELITADMQPISNAELAVLRAAAQAAVPVAVPQSVTMRQARLALLGAGLLSTVNTAVASMPGAAGEAARIEWEYSGEVHRNKALVQALAPVLGLNDAQLDTLFINAAAL